MQRACLNGVDGNARILLVDDEESIIAVGSRMLESLGYTVTGALGGEAAIEMLRAAPEAFDLIVTDQVMPRVDGKHVLSVARELRPDIAVVVITGFPDALPEGLMQDLSGVIVVFKPLTRQRLGAAIRGALDGAHGA